MKTITTHIIAIALALFVLSGCAATQPQPSQAQIEQIMQTLENRGGPAGSRPALDLSTHPIVAVVIENDTIGLQDAIAQRLDNMGMTVVHDPSLVELGAVLSGEIVFIGNPEDAPQHRNLRQAGKYAAIGGAATSAVRFGTKMGSPMSLVSSGVGFLTKTAAKAMAPDQTQAMVKLRVRQNGRIWDIDLNITVEAPRDKANQELAQHLADSALKKLQG